LGGADFDGRGVAFADVDGDGDLDVCVTADAGEPTRIWRNDTAIVNNWLTVKLVGMSSNRSAVGARVTVTAGGNSYVKEVSGGAGRGSFNSLPVEFGLGAGVTIADVQVDWPSGFSRTWPEISVDQVSTITEPLFGDINSDDEVNLLDVTPFVNQILTGHYLAEADMNFDGVVDLLDVEGFVNILLGQ